MKFIITDLYFKASEQNGAKKNGAKEEALFFQMYQNVQPYYFCESNPNQFAMEIFLEM